MLVSAVMPLRRRLRAFKLCDILGQYPIDVQGRGNVRGIERVHVDFCSEGQKTSESDTCESVLRLTARNLQVEANVDESKRPRGDLMVPVSHH